ncbi:translation protein [Durotheca rogersii]|uniref:translation protein n=1 Tax=Durotheca rogersii TaxID=419775 RepID=UPI0022209684|nr:translation protein [Durotheca rogersii]KAI5862390.1 translation protein [Durotheca rogersii]
MSHCHDEHHDHSHGHDHDHGHGGHDHGDHDHSDDITPALQFSLYQHIRFEEVEALNEAVRGAGKAIVKKTWAERLQPEPELASDTDEQLIIKIPFTGQVKLHSVLLRSSASSSAPHTIKLFANRNNVDFEMAEQLSATQTLEPAQTSDVQELPVRRALFSKVQHLTLFVEKNFGDGEEDVTRLSYLGFRGEWMQLGRAPAQILYEAAPNPSDHKLKGRRRRALFATSSPDAPSSLGLLPSSTDTAYIAAALSGTHRSPRATMASRLPVRWASSAAALTKSTSASRPRILVTSERHTLLLPRTAKRGVKIGWSTQNPRVRPRRFNQETAGLPTLTASPAAALKRKEQSTPVRTGVLATKKGVSAMFSSKGKRIPCTILQMDQVQVVATKTRAKNGYWAVQIGCGQREADNVTLPQLGYYEARGIAPKSDLAEFRVRGEEGLLPIGLQLQPDWFKVGQFVDARSNSRGMGFAGGMKRHNFSGQEASHGNSLNHRTIGTTGPSQGGGSRVHPGKKMPGRMGNEQVTIQNLRVLKVDNKMGIVVINGHVAGPKGCIVKLADAIKKPPPVQTFVDKARRITLERDPLYEERLLAAQETHEQLKKLRREGRIGDAAAHRGFDCLVQTRQY